jgi:hypothetical protein
LLEGHGDETYPIGMEAITLKAHFDGERIQLDEPFDLPTNTPLMVTVLTPELESERADWSRAAAAALARAYGDNEPEYGPSDIKP